VTIQALIIEAEKAGISLAATGHTLRVKAPVGKLTAELRAELAAQKPILLEVLSRLEGMRENDGSVPIACAVFDAVGGPGRCFSCGESLEHPEAYGRCSPCGIAAELFYAARHAGERAEVA
jgi:hypothetical protein